MGRAIVREPQVFLMDEPLSNLDAKLRVQTRTQIALLQERLGVTTVYVTHDQVEAMTMGDRVAALKDGVLMQCDTPQNLYDRPANVFVAGFIGSPAMNLLDLKLVEGGAMFGDQPSAAGSQRDERRRSHWRGPGNGRAPPGGPRDHHRERLAVHGQPGRGPWCRCLRSRHSASCTTAPPRTSPMRTDGRSQPAQGRDHAARDRHGFVCMPSTPVSGVRLGP